MCSLFRNESSVLSSELIRQAVSATVHEWGEPPPKGFTTFVDNRKTKSDNPGYCFKCAGWEQVGETKSGLIVLRLDRDQFPKPCTPHGSQRSLFQLPDRDWTNELSENVNE